MLIRNSVASPPPANLASGGPTLVVSARRSPRQNDLLAALPPGDYERPLPMLELVDLPRGWMLQRAGDPQPYVYFIAAGVVSRVYVTSGGESAEFAVTGREGVIGIASFLGGETMPSEAVVRCAGYAYRLRIEALEAEVEEHGALLEARACECYAVVKRAYGRLLPQYREHEFAA